MRYGRRMDLERTVTIEIVEWRRVQDDRAYLTRRVHELTDEVDQLKDALRRAKASLNASNGRRSPRSRSRTPQRHPPAGTSNLPGTPTASVPSHERSAARWIEGDASATPRREPSTRIGAVSASGGARYSYRRAGGETPSGLGTNIPGNDSSTETDGDARSFAESFATTRSEAGRWATRDAARASTAAGRLMRGQHQHRHDRHHHHHQQHQRHQRQRPTRRVIEDDGGADGRIESPSRAPTPWSSASRLDAAERMALLQAEIESLRVAMEAPYGESSNDGLRGDVARDSELLFGDGGEPLPPHPWRGVSGAERVYAASLTNSRSDQSTRSTGSAASTPLRVERSPGRRRHGRSSSRESLGSPARPKRTNEEATWDVNVDDIL